MNATKNTIFSQNTTINCNGRLLDLSSPVVMGILNITPDSFYDGGFLPDEKSLLQRTEKFLKEGAAILDVGGMSSRPGSNFVSAEEELNRVIPAIDAIKKDFPDALISIDTWRSKIAQEAIQHGASIVNDISAGLLDQKLFQTIAQFKVPYVLMHMQGTPDKMQEDPQYKNVVQEVMDFFKSKINELHSLGIYDIIIDPGFGFGKTVAHNLQLLHHLDLFQIFGLPVMAGLSRKSMICKILRVNPEHALNGTTALHSIALLKGTKILRVHDVREARETIQLIEAYKDALV